MFDPKFARRSEMIGHRIAEDLQRPFHAGGRGDRGTGRAAQVRVVEVRQPVGRRAHLASHPTLFPRQPGVLRAHPRQQGADRLAVAHHHSVRSANLARLRADPQPARGADKCQCRLRARTTDLQRRRPTRLGERAVRQKRSAPSCFGVGNAAADHLRGQAPHGPAPQIEQTGLSGQRLAVLGHPDQVPGALADSAGRYDMHRRAVAVQVVDVLAQPPGDDAEINLGLDHHPPRDDVQSAREPQQGGHLGASSTDRIDDQPTQLILDLGCHRHGSSPLGPFAVDVGTAGAGSAAPRRRTPSRAAANRAGSCKGVPGLDTSAN
nr:hypothetical protein CPGR_04547 [Mycolicibacterium malmesburyense]